jgi:hypothetical protein
MVGNESPKEAPTQRSERSRLAGKYRVEDDQIQIDPQPHDCDYETAPMGKKWCHYSRTVIVCAYGPCRVEGDTNTWLRTPEYFILHNGDRIHPVACQAIDDKYRMQLISGWIEVLATDVAKTEPDKKIFVIWNKVQE